MSKYKEIKNLYNLLLVKNMYIVSSDRKNKYYTLIYEIEEAVYININENIETKIFNIFKEFLKEVDFNFKIIIKSKKIDVDKYIQNIQDNTFDEIKNTDVYLDFINDLKKKLLKEKLYEKKYLFVATFNNDEQENVNNVENLLNKFKEIGCNVNKLENEEKINRILYESINKGVEYEF